MASASLQHSFLTGNLISPVPKPTRRSLPPQLLISCRSSMEKGSDPSGSEMKLAKLAMVTLAAGVLTLGSVHDAMAAKSGGRVGGQAFRPPAVPRTSGPRINNSRTNVFINPPMAPPLVGGYGYGVPFYGGWGWSPFTFFAPGPSVAVGIGGGFEVFAAFLVLGAITTVIRGFIGRREDDEDDY